MMNTEFEYMNEISKILEEVYEKNKDNIKIVAEKMAGTIMKDNLVHIFGTGHSSLLSTEMYSRAGGLANVDPILDPNAMMDFGGERSCQMERTSGISPVIYDLYDIKPEDMVIVISNSGRNAMPIEMAQKAKEKGNYVVVLTSLEVSKSMSSRHSSGKKLYEFADTVLDNCGRYGDCCIKVGNYDTGAISTITGSFILHTVETEATKIMVDKGFKPFLFQSQNIDGYDNSTIVSNYKHRIKHLF